MTCSWEIDDFEVEQWSQQVILTTHWLSLDVLVDMMLNNKELQLVNVLSHGNYEITHICTRQQGNNIFISRNYMII